MRVSAVQMAPSFKAWERNIVKASALVMSAVEKGADLIVLPELMTSGYSFMSKQEARPFAEVLSDSDSESTGPNSFYAMRSLASAQNVAIVWGCIEIDPETEDLYNSQVIALPDGTFKVCRKLNHWGNDFLWATAGKTSPPIIEYGGKKIGLLICRDVRDQGGGFKEFYEPGDADIVCFSSNWGSGGFPANAWMDFVADNKCWLVVSNRYGTEAHNNFGDGGICVISPEGKVNCEGLVWNQPCIVMQEV